MALTLLQVRSLKFGNDALRGRFEGALVKASWIPLSESAETENHSNRLAFAKKVLLDQEEMIEKYYLFFLSNATIQASIEAGADPSENDIYYVVATEHYNTVANAEAA